MLRGQLALVLFVIAAEALSAQGSSCAGCHFANPDAPGHLYEWERSPHGRNSVGCESCHGGDASSFDLLPAHSTVLNSHNPASPVNRRNLPRTCGACHAGPFVAYQSSRHYALLQEGNQETPVCTTCHSEVAGRLLSPSRLEARCSRCHSEGRDGGHPEFPGQARSLMESIEEIRAMLDEAQPLIRRIRNAQRREGYENQFEQAEIPLIEAVRAGHSFAFEALVERRETARRRAEALIESLANPEP